MHTVIDPAILYFGTPVVLVSSTNVDGSSNLAPMSSAWWLGHSCMLGFGARSLTPQVVGDTLGALLKYQDDVVRMQGDNLQKVLKEATSEV